MGRYQFSPQQRKDYESLPIPLGVYQIVDGKVVTLLVSDAMCQMHGMPRHELIKSLDESMFGFVHPDDIGRLAYFGQQEAKLGNRFKYDLIYRVKEPHTKDYYLMHAFGKRVVEPDGSKLLFIFYYKIDRSPLDFKKYDMDYVEHFKDEYNRDALTGLPNRHFIMNFGLEKVGKLRFSGKQPAAVLVNISNMKGYNDQFGKPAGDQLLVGVGKLLTRTFPDQIVSRYQGDRFLVIADQDQLEAKLLRVHDQFKCLVGGNAADIAFGIYKIQIGDSMNDIADHVHYALSQIGTDRRHFLWHYDNAAEKRDLSGNYYLDNLQKAIDQHWIKVFFQPIFDNKSQQISDYEALARWQDPERGLIGPGQFIPVIEKRHLTFMLDSYMLEEVAKKLHAWKQNGVALHPVSVNLSHEDFDRPEIVSELTRIVDKYEVDHSLIIIEITERDLSGDTTKLQKKMDELHALGFKFWMDDFGSGYSSLNSLYEYRFDLIKIDMKFVQHLDDNNGVNRKLMKSLVKVAKEMGLLTLTEGVETTDQYDFVREIGCDKTQGFLLVKPTPLDDYGQAIGNK